MPRLLSNKSPTKISKVKVEKIIKPKSEDEMTAWEYYSFLMRFGKRKMDRFEWLSWKEKKDLEDYNKKYSEDGRRKIGAKEFHWRIKKDRDFDERLYLIDDKLK